MKDGSIAPALLKKQTEKPAETLLLFYGCYCVGTFMVSVGISTLTGAIGGLLVVSPTPNIQQQASSNSISDACESVGIFIVRRSIRCGVTVKCGVWH